MRKCKLKQTFSLASFIALLVLLTITFLNNNKIISVLILICLATIWFFIFGFNVNFKIFIFSAIFGALAEIFSIYFNVWKYAQPDFLGIPIWLPLVWGMAGVYLNFVGKKLLDKL